VAGRKVARRQPPVENC